MEPVEIRRAEPTDLATLQQIGRDTFFETFAHINTEADMQAYLRESFSEAKVSAEIANPDSLFFIAWEGKTPLGYLKVNTGEAQTEALGATFFEIERLYVKSAYHGKKVGQLLYEQALTLARQQHKTQIWLGVWENNVRAIRFYEKNGFVAFDKHVFKLGDDEQIDVLMKKTLALA